MLKFGRPKQIRVCDLLVVGQSHVACLAMALEARPSPGIEVVNFRNFPTRRVPRGAGGKIDCDAFTRAQPRALCLLLGGNEHNVLGMFEHERPFTMAAEQPDLARTYLPMDMVVDAFEERLGGFLKDGRDLIAAFPNARPLVAMAPPPVADWGVITAHPDFAQRSEHSGRSSDGQRLAMWRAQSQVWRRFAGRHGARVVEVPRRCVTDTGLLAPAYTLDPTHGNAAYGTAMLEEIRSAALEPAA